MKKILIVGGRGMIGQELAALLGKKAIVMDHSLKSSNPSNFLSADITNITELRAVFLKHSFSACINLAAISLPLECEQNKDKAYLVNVVGNLNLLNLCSEYGVDFYFASSVKVYSGSGVVNEKSKTAPSSFYTLTKILSESFVKSFYESGLLKKAVIFRFSNVYGKDSNLERLIPSLILSAKKGVIKIFNSNSKFDMIYAGDVVKAIVLALRKSKGFEIYNVASGNQLPLLKIAGIVSNKANNNAKIEVITKTNCHYPKISISKIKSLGFKPIEFSKGLDKIMKFYE